MNLLQRFLRRLNRANLPLSDVRKVAAEHGYEVRVQGDCCFVLDTDGGIVEFFTLYMRDNVIYVKGE